VFVDDEKEQAGVESYERFIDALETSESYSAVTSCEAIRVEHTYLLLIDKLGSA
jgi:hypothetical protein